MTTLSSARDVRRIARACGVIAAVPRSGRARRAAAVVVLVFVGVLFRPAETAAQCPVNWRQSAPETTPSRRSNHAMAYDSARGVTVLFGGQASGFFGDTWEWNGTNWTQQTPATAPSARGRAAVAYDSMRGVTVLFGGFGVGYVLLADTWEWNGMNWTQRTPATAPAARRSPAIAYDSARGKTVLFGGSNGSPLDDTWEWDGTNWTQRTPATSPSGRSEHRMAYDSIRGVTVLFGGYGNGCLGDTWEWDGTNWTQRTPTTSPSARYDHAMAYDSARGVTVLFGGQTSSFFGDTWEWNGTNWTQRTPATAPSARPQLAMVWGPRIGTMLFGGWGGNPLADTWQYGPVVRIAQQPASCSVVNGGDAGFGVTVVNTGGDIPSYQWRKDGTPITDGAGPEKAFLRIPSAKQSDAGSYDCVVTAGACTWTSEPATLTVNCRSDFDDDGDVDLADFGVFRACFNGPNRPPACQ